MKSNKQKPKIYGTNSSKQKDGINRRNFIGLGAGAGLILGSTVNKVRAQNGSTGGKVSGNLCEQLTVHRSSVRCVAINTDSTLLATGSDDNSIKLWQLPEGNILQTLEGHSESVWSVAFSPDGKFLASGSGDNTIKIWRLPEGNLYKTLKDHTDDVTSVVFSPDGTQLLSGSSDQTIKIWQFPGGNLLKVLTEEYGRWCNLAYSPNGALLAAEGKDYHINIWRMPEGTLIKTLRGHKRDVSCIIFNPDSSLLASGGYDRTIKLWSIENSYADNSRITSTDNKKASVPDKAGLTPHNVAIGAVATHGISPGHREKNRVSMREGDQDHSCNTISKDSRKLITGLTAAALLIGCKGDNPTEPAEENPTEPAEELKISLLKTLESSHDVYSLAFSPDGTILAAGYFQSIELWRIPDGSVFKALTGHFSLVYSLVCDINHALLAMGGSYKNNGVLKFWTLPGGEPNGCLYDPALLRQTDVSQIMQKEKKLIDSVCTCNLVCTCDTVSVSPGTPLSGTTTCVCDTVVIGDICTCDTLCSCDAVCTCDNHSAGCGGCGHYWHPN